MNRINKIDYFTGVFMTTIVNSLPETPIVFNKIEDNKTLVFEIDDRKYNGYIKYSTQLFKSDRSISPVNKIKISCKYIFSENEYLFLKNDFLKSHSQNFICLVFTNKDLAETYIAVLLFEDAMKCLEHKTEGGTRRITINRFGSDPHFYCHGVNFSDYEHIKVPVDFSKYLGLLDYNPHNQLSLFKDY